MNVLIVEDNAQDAELLRLTLQRADGNANIVRAETIAQACQQVRQADYDVVLLDLGLPDSDGLTTVRQLQSANDSVPIVILSGYDDDQLAREAVHLGAEDYMVKGDENSDVIIRAVLYAIERHHNAQELRYRADHDPLTGALNRTEFLQETDRAISFAEPAKQTVAVFTVDLDHFGSANGLLGHAGGDQLLRESAERLRQHLRHGDDIARLKGDQFAIMFTAVADETVAERLADSIHNSFATSFTIAGESVSVTVSIGIASYPADGRSADELLGKADSAMHQAKEHGRSRTHFFSEVTNQRLRKRRAMRDQLQAAIQGQQLEVHFQPRFARSTRDIHSLAASLRWRHPSRGLLDSGSFLPDAERAGLSEKIEECYIDLLTDQVCNWVLERPDLPFVSLALSPALWQCAYLPEHLERVLLLRSLNPGLLEISIPDSALLQDRRRTIENIHRVRDLGVRTAISESTGCMSLGDASRLPLESINVGGTLIAELEEHGTSAIVNALIVFAHDLGLTVSAEGIHSETQLRLLSDMGCDVVQGDYLLESLDAERMGKLLQISQGPHRADIH